jgi:hypothetical protein
MPLGGFSPTPLFLSLPPHRQPLAGAFAPFYRLLEFFKLLTGHGLPYFLITEP